MNRKINYLHFLSLIVPFIFVFLIAEQVYADQFTYVKFQESYKVTKKIYYVHVIKMGSRLKGAKKITLKSTNLNVVYVNSEAATSEKIVFFSPQKKGKAVVTAKVTTSSGTKTYKFRIGVKTNPPAASSSKKTTKTTKKTVKKYTVKFKPNKGTVSKKSKKVEKNGKYGSLPTPKRNYYSFTGWYTKSSGGKKVTSKTKIVKNANHKLYAHWKAKEYTVTYKLNGGTNNSKNKKHFTVETSTFSLYSPKRSGYDFGGWYKDSAFKTKITQIKKGTHSSITVYARWIKRTKLFLNPDDIKGSKVNTVFSTLYNGTISAEKNDGEWYYKFTKGNNAILIPVWCFDDESDDDVPQWFNQKITNGFNTGYKTADAVADSHAEFITINSSPYVDSDLNQIGSTRTIYKSRGGMAKHGRDFILDCTLINAVSFSKEVSGYTGVEPNTASGYVSILKRSYSKLKMIPDMNVEMNSPQYYNGELFYHYFDINGYGLKRGLDVGNLIEIGISSYKTITSLLELKFTTCFDLYSLTEKLTASNQSAAYKYAGNKNMLSNSDLNDYCYACNFESPIALKNKNDRIEFDIYSADENMPMEFNGFKGTNTEITFSMKYE